MATNTRSVVERALNDGQGIVRLKPNWVPRVFCVPGRRLRLHPRDLYALGGNRGGIDERWFASTVRADNGPLTAPHEGLSFIWTPDESVTLAEAFDLQGAAFLGQETLDKYGGWVMYSKFFDNMYPLPHHLHQSDEKAAEVGKLGKPEAYYYPPQYNHTEGTFPYTFLGLDPNTTKDDVVACLRRWNDGDNGILGLSRAFRLALGTGWDIAPGILHAPGTLCTYEPQRASDVFSMWQSLVADYQIVGWDMLVKDVPADRHNDIDYIMSLLDWEANVDPDFSAHHFTRPQSTQSTEEASYSGFAEKWIVYGSEYYSAKELTVYPGRSVRVKDAAAYGAICIQGHGRFGVHPVSAPHMIRYGEMTEDEFFVSLSAASQGVEITNTSTVEPLVILKHFNPGNSEMPARI